MTELVAIGYSDAFTANAAMDDLESAARSLLIRPDEIAVIVRAEDGTLTSYANANIAAGNPTWAMFWGALFGMLYFVPLLGMPVGEDLGPLIRKVERSGIDLEFIERAREMLEPETSALFLLVENVTPDRVVEALERYGGTVLQCPLSREAERMLQEALHGRPAAG